MTPVAAQPFGQRLFQNKLIWLVAIGSSALLLALVFTQLDVAVFSRTLRTVNLALLLTALLLLIAEGVLTGLRIRLFAGNQPGVVQALYANAWYVLLLNILPVRLGEVAAVFVFERQLAQTRGAAVMSIVTQRLFDIIMLGCCFVLIIGLASYISSPLLAYLVGALAIAGAVATLIYLDRLLAATAQLMVRRGWHRQRWSRPLLKLLLQARRWHHLHAGSGQLALASLLTALKWLSAFAAISCLLRAAGVPLAWFELLCVCAGYCFLAIVPLQTIGGLGLSEAGLALMLSALGIAPAEAIAYSLVTRVFLLLFPLLFFVAVAALRHGDSKRNTG